MYKQRQNHLKREKLKEKNIFLFKTKNEKKFLDSIELFITWNGGR